MEGARPVRAARGTTLTAKSWATEAPLRMLMNNLDPENAERPDDPGVIGTHRQRRVREVVPVNREVSLLQDVGFEVPAHEMWGEGEVGHSRLRVDRHTSSIEVGALPDVGHLSTTVPAGQGVETAPRSDHPVDQRRTGHGVTGR